MRYVIYKKAPAVWVYNKNMEAKIFNNFVDLKDCNKMIDRFEYLCSIGQVVKRDDGRVGLINSDDIIFQNFVKKYYDKAITTLNDSYTIYNGYIATKYDTGVGMNSHIDSEEGEEMGVLMYLNDEYEGGELTYTASDGVERSIKAKTGDMIYCPSWYLHGVNKVTSGIRYFFTFSLLKQK